MSRFLLKDILQERNDCLSCIKTFGARNEWRVLSAGEYTKEEGRYVFR